MNKERLVRLADLLERDANDRNGVKFDLGLWGNPAKPQMPDDYSRGYRWASDDPNTVKVDCGTTACALGLAAISGEFKDDGLSYRFVAQIDGGFALIPQMGIYEEGFTAGEVLFGISDSDARYLFDPDCYDETPIGAQGELYVADRIQQFIIGEIDKTQHPDHRYPDYEPEYHDED